MLSNLIQVSPAEFLENLTVELAGPGFGVFPELFRPNVVKEVRREMELLRARGAFRPAGVGKGSSEIAPETRGDGTFWFEPAELSNTQAKIRDVIECVRDRLNAELYLGLWDWEGHYAIYPPGTFYRKHLDRFAKDSRRTVSVVFFFNSEWSTLSGGQLRLDLGGATRDVAPEGGTAVFFLSDRIPHEVMETLRERFSFAGWLRTRA